MQWSSWECSWHCYGLVTVCFCCFQTLCGRYPMTASLSCSLDGTTRLWDIASGRCLRVVQDPTNAEVLCCVFHPLNNNLFVVSFQCSDTHTGGLLLRWCAGGLISTSLTFGPPLQNKWRRTSAWIESALVGTCSRATSSLLWSAEVRILFPVITTIYLWKRIAPQA